MANDEVLQEGSSDNTMSTCTDSTDIVCHKWRRNLHVIREVTFHCIDNFILSRSMIKIHYSGIQGYLYIANQ